jgi:hypothetical protein
MPSAVPSSAPRIRVPSSGELIHEEVVPGSIHTTSYQVGMAGGVQGQPMQIPPQGYVPQQFAPQGSAPQPIMSDGFRARGTSGQQYPSGGSNPAVPALTVTPG